MKLMRDKAVARSGQQYGYAESGMELNRQPQGAGNKSMPVLKIGSLQALSALLGHPRDYGFVRIDPKLSL